MSGQPLRLKKLVLGRIAEMDGGRSGSDVGESGIGIPEIIN